jgi:uncharacterized cupredoxin-like copper-binding protein
VIHRPAVLVLLGAVALVVPACGRDGATGSGAVADRSITVVMTDNSYRPATITVATGETIRFVFRNEGTVDHDAFIGDDASQAEHESEMADDMGAMHHQADANAVTVEPGQPGHYADGMKIAVTVA